MTATPAAFLRPLLATEHSEFDVGAERVALALAARRGEPLATVLPMVGNPEFDAVAPDMAARADALAADKLQHLQALAATQGVRLAVQVRRGPEPYREIVDEAKEQGSELIIIRRRGKRSFLANLLVGEMVSKVVAHAPCHVLIVPRDGRMWNQRVLVAAEPTPQGRQIIATAVAVAAQCGLPLHLVSVVPAEGLRPQADAFINEMTNKARLGGVTAQGEVRTGKSFTEILNSATTCQADLIVIGSRGDNRIGRALVGGVAQKVMGLSEHPVLVLHLP